MSTTTPVNESAMPQGGIRVFIRDNIGGTRHEVGVIDDPVSELAGKTIDVDYHNYSTKKVVDGNKQNFKFRMYELRPELLEIINKGLSVTKIYDGATVEAAYTQVVKAGEWGYGPDGSILLDLTNVGGVIALTSINGSVDGDVSAGTATSDWGNGYTRAEFTSGVPFTTLQQDLTLVFDATPTAGFYEKPKASGLPSGFVAELQRDGEDAAGSPMQILKIFTDCKPEKPVVTFQGDKDDKGAYIDVAIEGTVKDVKYEGFETP